MFRWMVRAIAGLALVSPLMAWAGEALTTRLVLPPVVSVFEAGLTEAARHGQWSQEATGHVEAAWTTALAGRAVAVGALAQDQAAAVSEFQRLALQVARNASQQASGGLQGLAGFDTRLGPSLSFLAAEHGATTVIGLVAVQVEQSKASAATQAALTASMFFQSALLLLPAFTGVTLVAFEADARTGQLLWYEFDRAVEVGGLNTGDLRDPESTTRLLGTLAAKLPATPSPGPAVGNAAPKVAKARTAMALQGYFQFETPTGWTTQPARRSVAATRDGPELNAIEVRLTPRGEAFGKTRPRWTSKSTPEQFAQWLAAELRASDLMDLQVLEAGPAGELAGKPAFRLRYIHRGWVDGPMQETVVVGTSLTRGLLLASLTAPHLAYFERALPDFESMLPTVEQAPIRN